MNSIDQIITNPKSLWLNGSGPASDIVISSRVRLARNQAKTPFPNRMGADEAETILKRVEKWVREIPNANGDVPNANGDVPADLVFYPLDDLDSLTRQVLVEKHLISPLLAQKKAAGLVLSRDEVAAIMVNEEDHLRIQCLLPGLQVQKAWELADRIDGLLEKPFDYAVSDDLGYLTSCPTNLGTGIRASVMMHLPALVGLGEIRRVMDTLSKVGVVVRGLYGEGTEAIGNLFQISNQITLGHSEDEIIENLSGICRQIIDQERSAREKLLNHREGQIEDRVCRAYGLLTNARIMSSDEALARLSEMRFGIDLNIVAHLKPQIFNELLVLTRPGYLQKWAGEELSPEERDRRRASLIREKIAEYERAEKAE